MCARFKVGAFLPKEKKKMTLTSQPSFRGLIMVMTSAKENRLRLRKFRDEDRDSRHTVRGEAVAAGRFSCLKCRVHHPGFLGGNLCSVSITVLMVKSEVSELLILFLKSLYLTQQHD